MKLLKGFRTSLTLTVITVLGLATSQSAQAGVINFENIPSAYQGLPISNQYQASHGVTFSLVDPSNLSNVLGSPVLAKVGFQTASPGSLEKPDQPGCFGFYYSAATSPDAICDSVNPEVNIGQFFLTDDDRGVDSVSKSLLISYSNPVAAASADILDIDAQNRPDGSKVYEGWAITALGKDAGGNYVQLETKTLDASALLPPSNNPSDPGSGDGTARSWSFGYRSQADIYGVLISYSGTKDKVGLGFDNFNTDTPVSVPEPASVMGLLALGVFGAGSLLKRKKSAVE